MGRVGGIALVLGGFEWVGNGGLNLVTYVRRRLRCLRCLYKQENLTT